MGLQKFKKSTKFSKRESKFLASFFMGLRTLAAVSGLAHFFEEIALPIGPDSEPANADWLKKVKHTYSMQRFSQ
jgi:hypothetical protein